MSQFVVDEELCRKDGICVAVCPSGVLAQGKEGFPEEVPGSRCIACGHCVAVCPHEALTYTGLPEGELFAAARELPSAELMDNFLMSRRSVRIYKEKPLARETLEALLEVARRAPTASNSQKLHWIVVAGAAKVHALAGETVNWVRGTGKNPEMVARWEAGRDGVLRGAPAVVVACAPQDYQWGKEDSAIALSYLELAAEARGLGACWAGILTRVAALHPPLRAALDVPEGYAICGGLMLGERQYTYRRIPPRKPLSVQWV
jgi:nitroreductase/NAD-dependent dihydropyrimidine dehydrogenase PreA subunit